MRGKNGISILLFSIIFMILSNVCVASGAMPFPSSGEITSPYGSRTHPIFGTTKFHDGIDLGVDEGTAVQAVADGKVIEADENDGYGNYVEIDHGNGLHSFYGHNSQLMVSAGQTVTVGTLIAYSGSTGYSTGPHLHFCMHVNGESVNPMDYLDGSKVMPDSTAVGPDGINYLNSDYDEISWDLDSYFDFAKVFKDTINTFSNQCKLGIQLIQADVKWLFFAFITIDLAMAAMFNLFDPEGEEIFNWLFKRFLKYGFVLFMIIHWGDIVANALQSYFVYMGSTAAGAPPESSGLILSDPSGIVQKGAYLVGPVFAYISSVHGIAVLWNLPSVFMAIILGFAIFACYFVIGFEIMLAYLEFYIISALSVVTMGFGGLSETKFVAEKGFAAIFQVALKLMLYSFLTIILTNVLANYTTVAYSFSEYLRILLGSMTFMFISFRISKTIDNLLGGGGGPSL